MTPVANVGSPRAEGSAAAPVGAGGLAAVPELLWAPARAFARLAATPAWVGLLALYALLYAGGSAIALRATQDFQIESTERMLDRMNVPDDARADALSKLPEPGDTSAPVLFKSLGGAALGAAIAGLVGALVILALLRIMGHTLGFTRVLALFFGAGVATGLGALIRGAVMAAAGTVEISLGPGALFPDLPFHSPLAILLDQFDPFSLWNVALLGIGLGVMNRMGRGAAFGIAGTYWIAKGVLLGGLRLGVSWMMGSL